MSLDDALARLSDRNTVLLINERSGQAAVQVSAAGVMLDDGEIERRVGLIRPMEQHKIPLTMMAESGWTEADQERFGVFMPVVADHGFTQGAAPTSSSATMRVDTSA